MDYRVVVSGDYAVGKTCLLSQFVNQTFTDAHSHTVGVDFHKKTMKLDGQCIEGQYWDTSGLERMRGFPDILYKGHKCCGALLVYDVTNQWSFDNLGLWYEKCIRYSELPLATVIVGNKCDLEDKKVVDFNIAKNYADSIGAFIIEVSAKTDINVEQAFVSLVAKIIELKKKRVTLKS